jgi:predicted GTPase
VKDCYVIGKANVGKTAFVINFAEFLSMKKINLVFRYPDGVKYSRNYTIEEAQKELVQTTVHTTRCLQSIILSLPAGKTEKKFHLIDTTGLSDGIHEDVEVRKAMAQTLSCLKYGGILLHLIDGSEIGSQTGKILSDIEEQIIHYAGQKNNYALLVNKMDLPRSVEGFEKVKKRYSVKTVLPISALYQQGFKEVKAFVGRNI